MYFPALADSLWQQSGLDSRPSCSARSTRSAAGYSESIGPMSRSTTTSEPLRQTSFLDPSTSSPGDSPANLTASPGSDSARQTTATSGRKWLALLAKSGPAGSLVKTLLASSRWRSTIVCLTWKASATKRGRLYFRLVPSTPRIDETASGLWPTVTINGNNNRAGLSAKSGDGLATAVKLALIPTPRTEGFDAGRHRGKTDSLHSYAKSLLPTPAKADGERGSEHYYHGPSNPTLLGAARLLATPQYHDYKSGTGFDPEGRGHSPQLRHIAGGTLNPEWVLWLMGYPDGWLD